MAASKASEAMFDVREDEEQAERLQDCVDLLVAAGYFRARVKGVPAFDKIVGGMVWCISTCNYTVDVDLLYAENATIGHKIALTEKIVEVLPQLHCPYSIEPHQIQGFDYIHIFPVIQWLVKRAIEAKEEHGDQLKKFVDYLHDQKYGKTCSSDSSTSFTQRLSDLSASSGAPKRVYRRGDGVQTDSIHEDLVYTLAEYANGRSFTHSSSCTLLQSGDGTAKIVDNLQMASTSSGVNAKALDTLHSSRLINQEIVDVAVSVEEMNCQLETLKEEEEELDAEIEEMKKEVERRMDEGRELDERFERYHQLEGEYLESEKESLRHLVEEYSDAAASETMFKKACREELEKIEEEIEKKKERIDRIERNEENESSTELSSLSITLQGTRKSAGEAARHVARLQMTIDSVPSQYELAQYQRRFVELGNEIVSEHRRLRAAFSEYNTQFDVRDYLKKEADLLNTIEEIITKSRDDYRDSLCDKVQTVLRGLDNNLDKLTHREKEAESERDKLSHQLCTLKEKERQYYKTIDNFKKACELNSELEERTKERGLQRLYD